VSDLVTTDRSELARKQGDDRHRLSTERHELHLITLGVRMNQDDGPEVSLLQAAVGKISRQNHGVEFANHP
jgi:hypothetical protein